MALPGGRRAADIAPRWAVYASAQGNYFFQEIRDLLACGLEGLPAAVERRDERDGFAPDAACHVVVAPHEFFYLGRGPELRDRPWPGRVVLVNTEQPSTPWFADAGRCFARAWRIWDIDSESARRLAAAGWPAAFLPLGHAAGAEFARVVARLPRHPGTCFLGAGERSTAYRDAPAAARPLDVLFVGNVTPRRQQFFARAAPVLARYRCYLAFADGTGPAVPGRTTALDTPTVLGLAQRSKILLNVHRGEDRYFEWHRVVLQGIWQRALVVSEPCGPAPPFQPGVDYVEAPLEHLPACLDHILSSPGALQEAQAIIDTGYRTLTERCDLTASLRGLLAAGADRRAA
jgi:hypothetical protein